MMSELAIHFCLPVCMRVRIFCAAWLTNLHLVHRLDRLTSGLVVFAESSKRSGEIAEQMRNRQTKKMYLARVKGRFPASKLFELQKLASLAPVDATTQNKEREEKKPPPPAAYHHKPVTTEDVQAATR